mgnify:FL=1
MKYFKTYATYINEELSGHAKKMKEDGLSDDEIKKMHPEVTDEDLNEAKKFKAGDMWSKTFDYGGMLAAGLKVNVNTPIGELNKLFDSFTDVNYHREAKDLLDAIDKIESGDKKAASKHIDMFHKACKETLKTNEASNVMKDLEKIGGQIDYLSDADDKTKKIWKKAGVNPEDDNQIIIYSYVNSWPETKKLLDKSKVKYKELEDPNSSGESFIVFSESLVTEAKVKVTKKDIKDIEDSGNIDIAYKKAMALLKSLSESVVNEAKFVKEFDKEVLDAKTKKEVTEVYPKAKFYVGKSNHFFGDLEDNLFFKAYYTKGQKEFEIRSVYSKKGSNYVYLFNESLTEAYSDEQRMELADKGFALSDGSYPIKDLKDLKNAIMAYGRAKDQSRTAKFIVKRAKALGAEDLIPDTDDFQKSLKA